MQLSAMLDPVGYYTHVMEESNYGRQPHPIGDKWGFLRDALAQYAPETDVDAVIQLFEGVGAHDDHQAARWLLRHDELIP